MAVSWNAGNTDFKFYQGSSSSNAWTRDLLWKRSIADEAKLLGFLPKNNQNINQNKVGESGVGTTLKAGDTTSSTMTKSAVVSPRRLPPMDTSLPLPSARSSSMLHHLQKMKQKLQTQEIRQKAILARAHEMYVDRKRFGGKLNRKEDQSWAAFMSNLQAPTKHISKITGEIDPSVANVSHTRFDSRPRTSGSKTRRRTHLAQTRYFVAQKNRRAANRIAIASEQKRLRLGGREPPFLTDSAAYSQLGGRPSTTAAGLYGKPVEEIVPRYGSVTDLPIYDEPHLWEEEGDLNVGEVLAPIPGEEDNKEMYKTAYRLSFPRSKDNEVAEDLVEEVSEKKGNGEVDNDLEQQEVQHDQQRGEHYVLIPEEEQNSIINADKLINMLEEENQARKTARGFKRRSLTRGSSRRSTVKPTGLTGRPGTTPTC
jgi:hypothetical protein